MNYRCCKFLHKSGAVRSWLDIYILERRDVGQNVLQTSFQTESISSHFCLAICFLIASLDEAFIRNMLCISYVIIIIIIICINDDSAVINNNYGPQQDLILLFRITMGTQKVRRACFRQSAHEGGKVVSPTYRPRLPPGRYPLISVRGWVDPTAIVWLEGLSQWIIPMIHRESNPAPCGL
jgi:hypothetical protein